MKEKILIISLSEARNLYRNNYQLNDFLLTTFTKQDLEQKITQEEFDEEFLKCIEIGKKNVRFLNGCNRFELLNQNNEWLFDINYDPENPHFLISYHRIFLYFWNKYRLECLEQQELTKNLIKTYFKMNNVIPSFA